MSGLEILGVAASVLQVADAGLRLSKSLYAYIESVSFADKRLVRIAKHVRLASCVVRDIGELFQREDILKVASTSAIATARETSDECERIFNELSAAIEKSRQVNSKNAPFWKPADAK
jgi:hypothetical protein